MMKNLVAIQASLEAECIEAKTYIKFHRQYGLDATWLNEVINYNDENLKLVGLRKRGRLALIVLKNNDNKEVIWEINKCIKQFKK